MRYKFSGNEMAAKKTPTRSGRTTKTSSKRTTKKKAAKKKRDPRGRKPQNLPTVHESLAEQGAKFLMEPKRRGVGRPTKYTPDLVDRVPAMFEEGESIAEVCMELGVSKDAFNKWREKYPEFNAAVKDGLARSEAWWIKLGRLGGSGLVKIQPATWVFNMKNRFDWRDKTETEHKGEVSSKLVIGGPSNPEDWEAAARRQQEIMRGSK